MITLTKHFQSSDKLSPLEIIAILCNKLEEGISEDQILKLLDPHDEYAEDFISFYIEFAIENEWIIKEDNGKYTITYHGREFINAFLPCSPNSLPRLIRWRSGRT